MNDLWNQEYWGNPVSHYVIVVAVIGIVWLIRRLLSRYFAGLLFAVIHRIWRGVEKQSFTSLIMKPLGGFLAVLITLTTLYKLRFPEELNAEIYRYTVRDILHSIGTALLLIYFVGLLLRIIDFIALILEKKANLTPDQADNQLIVFFKDFLKVILVIIGIMLVLRFAFELNISGLLTGLSIVGAAIALALRESLENLIASFIIFFDKPFITGDFVKVHAITGIVERIGLRSTRIRTDQKTLVTVPNKQMVDSIVDNLSLRTQRRADIRLELEPKTSAAQTEALLAGLREILKRKEVELFNITLADITANSIVLLSDYYTEPVTIPEFNRIREEVNMAILRQMEQLEIEIAGANTNVRMEQ